MDGERQKIETQKNPLKESFNASEVAEIKTELEANPEIRQRAQEDAITLTKIAEKMGRKTRMVFAGFAAILASHMIEPKSVSADESKQVAKIEMQELNLDKLKEKLKVTDNLRTLAEYEDPVASYVFACDRAIFMAEHMKDMLSSEKEIFLQNANKLPSVKEVENVNNAEGRMYFLGEYQKQIGAVNSVGGEIQSRIEQGYTITDVAQNGE